MMATDKTGAKRIQEESKYINNHDKVNAKTKSKITRTSNSRTHALNDVGMSNKIEEEEHKSSMSSSSSNRENFRKSNSKNATKKQATTIQDET